MLNVSPLAEILDLFDCASAVVRAHGEGCDEDDCEEEESRERGDSTLASKARGASSRLLEDKRVGELSTTLRLPLL